MSDEIQSNRDVPGWLIVNPDAVPQHWQERALPAMVVPLTPAEADQLFAAKPIETGLQTADLELVRLIASGHTAAEIGRSLNLSTRTVYRRVTALRRELEVETIEELATELARRGF
ncbi:MAG TPA: LuxR C-terminal-related transcriptional regulator [Actinomycetota bacterium]|nr:LuxR C-terminal-related transcriptional regulator [Actinomycetota bacterium]